MNSDKINRTFFLVLFFTVLNKPFNTVIRVLKIQNCCDTSESQSGFAGVTNVLKCHAVSIAKYLPMIKIIVLFSQYSKVQNL